MARPRKTKQSLQEGSIEEIVGQMISYRLLAEEAVKLSRPKCQQPPAQGCINLYQALAAVEVWNSAIRMLAPLLRRGG